MQGGLAGLTGPASRARNDVVHPSAAQHSPPPRKSHRQGWLAGVRRVPPSITRMCDQAVIWDDCLANFGGSLWHGWRGPPCARAFTHGPSAHQNVYMDPVQLTLTQSLGLQHARSTRLFAARQVPLCLSESSASPQSDRWRIILSRIRRPFPVVTNSWSPRPGPLIATRRSTQCGIGVHLA